MIQLQDLEDLADYIVMADSSDRLPLATGAELKTRWQHARVIKLQLHTRINADYELVECPGGLYIAVKEIKAKRARKTVIPD